MLHLRREGGRHSIIPSSSSWIKPLESFRRRFNGAISTGIQYSKGNETTQYNVASQVEYPRERWCDSGERQFQLCCQQ